MGQTTISWTCTHGKNGELLPGYTFNSWIGCAKVSKGCQFCYAEHDTFPRMMRSRGIELWGVNAARHVTSDKYWEQPKAWNLKAEREGVRRKVFCASLADVFEDRADLVEPRDRLFGLFDQTPWLDWLLLTKRPENVMGMLPFDLWKHGGWWPNVWMGATAEDQKNADRRVLILLSIPAPIRFLSIEPMLGPIDLKLFGVHKYDSGYAHGYECRVMDLVKWVIFGCESGPKRRPCDIEWVRDGLRQCREAGVAAFVKQLSIGGEVSRNSADWSGDLRVQQFPR